MDVYNKFIRLCQTPSDINEHLPTLSIYASKCESILELGVRGCVSSWAFTNGLLHNEGSKKSLYLNDISECNIEELKYALSGTGIELRYKWINDLQLELDENVDMTFIDTWHVYGQLKRELDKFSKVTNKYIILHDTTLDEVYGETIRNSWNPHLQSLETGIPVSEITCGLGKAVDEFLEKNHNWKLKQKFTNNNGLTVLERL
jgi:hypothetical protein